MKKLIGLVLLVALAATGCKVAEEVAQSRQDYETGKTAEYVDDEVPPAQQAQGLVDTFKALPYVGPFVPLALPFLVTFFTWKRGRRIRKGLLPSTHPVTGYAGASLKLEPLVQFLADLQAGAFEVGKDGSTLKRFWKVGLAGVLAAVIFSVHGVREFVTANSETIQELVGRLLLYAGGSVAAITATEKSLSIVKPVAPTT